jgi:hypothetical protein
MPLSTIVSEVNNRITEAHTKSRAITSVELNVTIVYLAPGATGIKGFSAVRFRN